MSGSNPTDRERPEVDATERVRQDLEQAEVGHVEGDAELEEERQADPAGTEAAEQEASDGPDGRGLSR